MKIIAVSIVLYLFMGYVLCRATGLNPKNDDDLGTIFRGLFIWPFAVVLFIFFLFDEFIQRIMGR